MNLLEKFETGVLFKLTRAFSICLTVVLLLVFGISVYNAVASLAPANSYPEPEEVFARLAPGAAQSSEDAVPQGTGSTPPSLALPFAVQRYLSDPAGRSKLLGQLSGLPANERSGYLRNLTVVVERAEKTDPRNVETAIYEYMRLTSERQRDVAGRKEAIESRRWQAVAVAFAALTLIALFSLILVLLAIERNTRSLSWQNPV